MSTEASTRVFVSFDNKNLDYTPAMDFGDLEFVAQADDSIKPYTTLENWADLTERVKESAANFDPFADHLILTGDPSLIGLVFFHFGRAAISKGSASLAVLKWDGREKAYQSIPVMLDLTI